MAAEHIRIWLKIVSKIISMAISVTGGLALLDRARVAPAIAQPIPDATLPSNSIVNTSNHTSTISGGTIATHNLFHSFEQFNIQQGQTVDFVNPGVDIQNILVRVTGGSRSEINGRLRTSGFSNPNFFLINPNGIVFGRNARLNVGGSFIATTANAIEFSHQGFFSASEPNDPTLLTMNPSAFFFNQIPIQPIITNRSGTGISRLEVANGQSLLFVGGNVRVESGFLRAQNGRVELGGLAETGAIGITEDRSNLHLSFPGDVARANVFINNGTLIDVQGTGNGSFAIHAGDIHLANSRIQAGIQARTRTANNQVNNQINDRVTNHTSYRVNDRVTNHTSHQISNSTGEITLNAIGRITADEASISNPAGELQISAETLFLFNGSQISVNPLGEGNAGDVAIHTEGQIALNRSFIYAEAFGGGVGGNISIDADQGTISLAAASLISTRSAGLADGGQIDIEARTLALSGGSQITSFSIGAGNAGDIQIRATDAVRIAGVEPDRGFSSGLITSSERDNSGRGGDIRVTTTTLNLADGGVLSARTRSNARGGDIRINTHTLEATAGGQVITSTFGSGRAGDIAIHAQDHILLSGNDPTYAARSTDDRGTGDSRSSLVGSILIDTILVDNDGANSGILARVRGRNNANAGNITISTPWLELSDRGRISTETTAGNGGNIRLQNLDLLQMDRGGNISASAGSERQGGNGGNIAVETQLIVVPPTANSDITANAFTGEGGNIAIETQGMFGIQVQPSLTVANDITASSDRGVQGTVTVRTFGTDPIQGLIELPTDLIDASRSIAQVCPTGNRISANNNAQNQFIVEGRGGLPPNVDEALGSDAVQVDLVTVDPVTLDSVTPDSVTLDPATLDSITDETARTNNNPHVSLLESATTDGAIVEAQGWVVNADGKVALTAAVPNVTPAHAQLTLICSPQSILEQHLAD